MIVVEHVTKYYGSHRAVHDLNFRIKDGECVGFLGLNGAGKTTTLRMLSCLLVPTSGRVTIRGFDVEDQPHEIRESIGYLPESPPLYLEMTVAEYVSFAGMLRGMTREQVHKRLPEVFAACGLQKVTKQLVGTLSHGYRQRVGIAQAIVHDPELLILDEPINGLDPVQIVEMRELIRNLRGKHTILLSSHILTEIEKTCDRILIIQNGQITAEGTEEQLANRIGAGARVELQLKGEQSQAHTALAKVQGASIAKIDEVGGVLRVVVQVPQEKITEVSKAVVESGLGLVGLRQLSSDLESIFMKMSHDEAAADAAKGRPSNGANSDDSDDDGEDSEASQDQKSSEQAAKE